MDYRSKDISKDFTQATCVATVIVSVGPYITDNYFIWTIACIILLMISIEVLSYTKTKLTKQEVKKKVVVVVPDEKEESRLVLRRDLSLTSIKQRDWKIKQGSLKKLKKQIRETIV